MQKLRSVVCALLLAAGVGLMVTAVFAPAAQPAWTAEASRRAFVVEPLSMPDGTIAVNSADLYELTELPGVGETIAQAIIDEREQNGPFRVPEDLLSVRGIGPKKLAGFRDLLDMSLPDKDDYE